MYSAERYRGTMHVLFLVCTVYMGCSLADSAGATPIEGYIYNSSGAAISGVTVEVWFNTRESTVTTNSSGKWTYNVTKTGYWQPKPIYQNKTYFVDKKYVDTSSSTTVRFPNLTISTSFVSHKIFGYVKNKQNEPVGGMTVVLYAGSGTAGAQHGTTSTNSSGYYELVGKATFSGTFTTAAREGSYIYGQSIKAVDLTKSSTDFGTIIINYVLPTTTHTISGTVQDADSRQGIGGVSVKAYNGSAIAGNTSTNSAGQYTLSNIPADQNYLVHFSKSGYIPNPHKESVEDLSDDEIVNVSLTKDIPEYGIKPVNVSPAAQSSQQASVSVTISNFGRTSVGIFPVVIYASTNSAVSVSGDTVLSPISPISVSTIAPGKDQTFTGTYSLTSLTQGQQYYIKAEIDSDPREYPLDDATDNIGVSEGPITVDVPQVTVCYPGILKVVGDITGQCSDPFFAVEKGICINDFLRIYDADATVYTVGDPHISWTGRGFTLDPLPAFGLKTVFNFPTARPFSIDTSTGVLTGVDNNGRLDLGLGKLNPLHISSHLAPYASGGALSIASDFALPFSRSSAMDLLRSDFDPFVPRKSNWSYIRAATTLSPAVALGEAVVDKQPLLESFLLDATSTIDYVGRTIAFTGKAALEPLALLGISLNEQLSLGYFAFELRTRNYLWPETLDLDFQSPVGVPIIPGPIPSVADVLTLSRLRLGWHGFEWPLLDYTSVAGISADVLTFGLQHGLEISALSLDADVGFSPLKLKLLLGRGEFGPGVDDGAELCLFPIAILGRPLYEGLKLYDVEGGISLVEGWGRLAAGISAELLPGLEVAAYGDIFLELWKLRLRALLEGRLKVLSSNTYPMLKGFVDTDPEMPTVATVCATLLQPSEQWIYLGVKGKIWGSQEYGIKMSPMFPWDLSVPEFGANLDYSRGEKRLKGQKTGPIACNIEPGTPNAILRLTFAEGDLVTTLTDSQGIEHRNEDIVVSQDNNGPIFYTRSYGVWTDLKHESALTNEICYYLIPEEGEESVTPGTYTIEVDDSQLVGDVTFELWTANTLPVIHVDDVLVPPGNTPSVTVQWTGTDPDSPGTLVHFYYDEDMAGYDGQLITSVAPETPDGPLPLDIDSGEAFIWETTNVPSGTYYVYASACDGQHLPVYSNYFVVPVTVIHADAPLPPSELKAVPNTNSIVCSWAASPTPEVSYVLYFDTERHAARGDYSFTQAVGELITWTIPNCTYGRTYYVLVEAYDKATGLASVAVGPVEVPLFSTTANNAPGITSTPVTEGRVGYPYEYQVTAVDVDGDALRYELMPRTVEGHPELVSPPPGVTIDPDTGLIAFTPVDGHLGSNRIEVKVSDNKGGSDTQEFYVNIDNWMSLNAEPVFDTVPPTIALVDTLFEYDADASDADDNQITYALQNAPEGMTIDSATGLVRWTPTTSDIGPHPLIVVLATDNRSPAVAQPMPLTVEYPIITADFTFSPSTEKSAPVEVIFTASSNYPKYVTNYSWDFGDGNTMSGPDKQVVKHVFNYDLPDDHALEDRVFAVQLSVYGQGYPSAQHVEVMHDLTVKPPTPVADFSADTWLGTLPQMDVVFTEECLWEMEYAWTVGTDPTILSTANSFPYHFEPEHPSRFGESIEIHLTASGPSGTATISKLIRLQAVEGTTIPVFDHPEGEADYWPGWHKASDTELAAPGLLSPTSIDMEKSEAALTIGANLVGQAVALSNSYTVYDNAFKYDVSFSSPTITGTSGVWEQVTPSAGWTGRWGHSVLVFDNKMWVLNGTEAGHNEKAEVWCSSDGATWTLATGSPGWLARYAQGALVFDNKMWILGGYSSDYNSHNDVWCSSDGSTWGEVTSAADWQARNYPMCTVFDGKMWLMGGGIDGTPHECNDIWASEDGQTWEEKTPTGEIWSERCGAAIVVHSGKIWVMGGYAHNPQDSSTIVAYQDVYCSDDGVVWEKVTDTVPWGSRSNFTCELSNGKIWVLGGSTNPQFNSGLMNDSWSSMDGLNWKLELASSGWGSRCAFGSARFNDTLWVLGGFESGYVNKNDVWRQPFGSMEDAYLVFSPEDYLKLTVTSRVFVLLQHINISGGEFSIVGEASGHLDSIVEDTQFTIQYNGQGLFEVLKDGMSTGISVPGTPSSDSLQAGLGFSNPNASANSISFQSASLVLLNGPPVFSALPEITLSLGGTDGSLSLNDYISDDITQDANLVLEVSPDNDVLPDIPVSASIDPVTHRLTIYTTRDFTEDQVLQIMATDEQGLSSTTTLRVRVLLADPLFTRITEGAGIGFINGTGAAVTDLNGDASIDLGAACSGAFPAQFVNQGNNMFIDETVARGLDAPADAQAQANADYDHDGFVDVVFIYADKTRLYHNDGTGHFMDATSAALAGVSGNSCVWADVDGDGDLDLYVVRNGANRLFLNQFKEIGVADFVESGASGLEDAGNSESAVFGDIDLDGDVDCYVTNAGGLSALYGNNGTGIFTTVSPSGAEVSGDAYGAVFADFNNDGYPDLYVATDANDVLFFNNGDGTFTAADAGITNGVSSRSMQALDYDNNGWLDIFVSNNGAENVLYHNNGDSTFSDVDMDLGLFSGVRGMINNAGAGAALGDIDNDGDMDIWQVCGNNQPPNLFRNNLDPGVFQGHNWLEVRLTGTVSNTLGIGARVVLYRNGLPWQMREVSGGSGWRSQNSLVQHFGLGDAEVVEELLVFWPSGVVTRRQFEPVNQILEITEANKIEAIQLTPGQVTLKPGDTVAFSAEGIYSSGDTEPLDVTTLYWELDNEAAGYVDQNAIVLGLEEGITHLTAMKEGLTSYPAEIIVSEHTLESLSVSPAETTLAIGETQQYTATATYDDASTEDVTTKATWFTDAPAIATIGASGRARAHTEGDVQIQAEYLGVLSDAVDLHVTAAQAQLVLGPADNRFYTEPNPEGEIPFTVQKTFVGEGEPPVDVTDQVTWWAANPFTAWVDGRGFWTLNSGDTILKAKSGDAESNAVSVRVRDHVSFSQDLPDSVRKYTGDSQTFDVELSGGYDPLTVSWFKDDGLLKGIGDLTLSPLDPDSSGVYHGEATDALGDSESSNTCELQVADHLTITKQPENTTRIFGESQTFSVETSGGFDPLTYQWSKDGIAVPDSNDSALGFDDLTEGHSGAYTVQISDDHTDNTTSLTATLIVTWGVPAVGILGTIVLAVSIMLLVSRKIRKERARNERS